MKKILLLLLFTANTCMAQPFIKYWDKSYGGNIQDNFYSIGSNNMGQFILAGTSGSPISGNKTDGNCASMANSGDSWIVKCDSSGAVIWDLCYGGNKGDGAASVRVLMNGNILITGISDSDSSCEKTENSRGTVDCWILMTDSNGVVLWDKTYGGTNYEDEGVSEITTTGNIVLASTSKSPISGDKTDSVWNFTNDYWILYLDGAGNKLWDKSYGGLGEDQVVAVCASTDGNILVGGIVQGSVGGDVTDSTLGGTSDYWIIKLDTAGNKIWDHLYGGSADESLRALRATNDGGAILCGWTNSPISGDVSEPPKGNTDAWVVKIDSLGNIQWNKRYGGNNGIAGTDILEYEDGYLIAAEIVSDSANDVTEPTYGLHDYWVLKIDSLGNKRWDKRFGGNNEEEPPKLAILPDNSIVVCGRAKGGTSAIKTDAGYGSWDYWAVRFKYIDPLVGISTLPENYEGGILIRPNPVHNEISITCNSIDKGTIIIYDQMGKVVYTKENTLLNTRCDISSLAKGVYFLTVKGDRFNEVVKVVKM